jgi:phosphoribosylformylglycinamidine (FGAM) synthase PurS component
VSIRNFVPEVWSANVDVALRAALIYAGPAVVNTEYEGTIRNQGDTVKVTSVGRPTIKDYVPGPGGTQIQPEPINAGQRVFQVDQAKYFALEVDDVDRAQAMGDLMPVALNEAGYAAADVVDRYVASLHTQIPSGNSIGSVTVDLTSPTGGLEAEARRVYDEMVVPTGVLLDEMNVPEMGRYMILPPWLFGCLRRDPRFIEAHKSANAAALRTGEVGNAAGFTFYKSNNVPQPTPGSYVLQAGTNRAITFANAITEIEAYRPESSFSDAVKSLMVYGAKVFRPDSIVKLTAVRT